MRLNPQDVDTRSLSPVTLAFVGDGVYELMVREHLACLANRPTGELHKRAVALVRAESQAKAARAVLPLLNEEETAVFKRGRNAHTARRGEDYHLSTALETLIGYLYLNDDLPRVQALFSHIMAAIG